MTSKIIITLTAQQIAAIKGIEAATRYEAMDAVARILNAKTGQRGTWASSRKTIIIDSNTHADITFSKGKVKQIYYYDNHYDISYEPIKIK